MKSSTLRSEFLALFDQRFEPLKLGDYEDIEDELVITIKLDTQTAKVWCRFVNRGTPLELKQTHESMTSRLAPADLKSAVERGTVIPTLIAPHLTIGAIDRCREMKIACFDLSGNGFIRGQGIFVHRIGLAPHVDERPKRNLFSRKSSRIARLLLEDPNLRWVARDLAKAAEISQAMATIALKPLAEQEWVQVDRGSKGGVTVLKPGAILDAWREAYDPPVVETVHLFSPKPEPKIMRQLADYMSKLKIPFAFTSFSGASALATVGNIEDVTVLVDAEKTSARVVETLSQALDWSSLGRGNISLVRVDDPFVLHGQQDIKRTPIAHPVQIYLDLCRDPRRGREQAQMFREAVIGF